MFQCTYSFLFDFYHHIGRKNDMANAAVKSITFMYDELAYNINELMENYMIQIDWYANP